MFRFLNFIDEFIHSLDGLFHFFTDDLVDLIGGQLYTDILIGV